MESQRGSASRWWLTAIAVAVTVVSTAAVVWMLLRGRPVQVLYTRWIVHVYPFGLFLVWLGRALLRRQVDHWLGRLFVLFSVLVTVHVVVIAISDAELMAVGIDTLSGEPFVPAEVPLAGAVAFWVSSWLWLTWSSVGFPILLLCFPDGKLPSRRWRVLLPVLSLGLVALAVGHGMATWPWATHAVRPDAVPLATAQTLGATLAGAVIVLGGTIAAIISTVIRWRRADGEVRRQIRLVGAATALLGLSVTVLWPWPWLWAAAQLVAGSLFFAIYSLAILRHRLHDLEVAVNRTVVGALLAAGVTVVYLAVVVAVGSLVGLRATHPLLPLIAVGLVAVLFEPARRRVRRLVDRMLYGRDADAFEVLTELTHHLRGAPSFDAVAGDVTQLLVRGTGALGARIDVDGAGQDSTLATTGDIDGPAALRQPIVHEGERLGEVVLFARTASDLAPDAATLLEQVAAMLGVVLRNVLLTAMLRAQLDDLRRSRQRLVTAQDEARRSLERDLHDGAQARLVALRMQVGLLAVAADGRGESDASAKMRDDLARFGEDLDAAIGSLRDLAHGLHPPLLESDGVAAAIRTAARGLPVDLVIHGGLERLPREVESTLYFCCLEAIKNAVTHGRARTVQVRFDHLAGQVRFEVEDDGCGFDAATVAAGGGLTNLADRVGALGGDVTVAATPGVGTRVAAVLPSQPLVSDR